MLSATASGLRRGASAATIAAAEALANQVKNAVGYRHAAVWFDSTSQLHKDPLSDTEKSP